MSFRGCFGAGICVSVPYIGRKGRAQEPTLGVENPAVSGNTLKVWKDSGDLACIS